MTDKEIFVKAFLKAFPDKYPENWLMEVYECGCLYEYIFSHKFAKPFWGEEITHTGMYFAGGKEERLPAWQYHLQQMVLEENPLKYLEKFL